MNFSTRPGQVFLWAALCVSLRVLASDAYVIPPAPSLSITPEKKISITPYPSVDAFRMLGSQDFATWTETAGAFSNLTWTATLDAATLIGWKSHR